MATIGDAVGLLEAKNKYEEENDEDTLFQDVSDKLGLELRLALEGDFLTPSPLLKKTDITPLRPNSQREFEKFRNWLKAYSSHFDNV